MTRRGTFWAAYAVGFTVAALIAVFAFSMLNSMVPRQVNWQALELTNLKGEPVSLEDYRGKPVLVNVWATWCKPCLKEMPAMEALQQSMPGKISILTVSDEEAGKLLKFREKKAYTFTYLRATKPLATQSLTLYPTTYLLDGEGDVAAVYIGAQEWASEAFKEKVLQLN
ncbi:TlpA family protein disulfide reductase [Pontibacter mangrovi]|uniref:TlpA family protein disulfide reductase n=1 Tax=Pontibacter mangrovi TaxID=2589816 RepID=A0A501W0E3_9BACT|nr:TlpA disulfide reductase family protein [Pontibacter mangrovi]TPE42758.1 TlpA family protein disulfide reductase [Pontibacter mangrovi]